MYIFVIFFSRHTSYFTHTQKSSYTCVAAHASNSKNETMEGSVSLMDKAQPPP